VSSAGKRTGARRGRRGQAGTGQRQAENEGGEAPERGTVGAQPGSQRLRLGSMNQDANNIFDDNLSKQFFLEGPRARCNVAPRNPSGNKPAREKPQCSEVSDLKLFSALVDPKPSNVDRSQLSNLWNQSSF
jgi:hypothetical protein